MPVDIMRGVLIDSVSNFDLSMLEVWRTFSKHQRIYRKLAAYTGIDGPFQLLDVMLAESILNKLSGFANVQFAHHICAMALDSPNTDAQQIADFFVRFALCN